MNLAQIDFQQLRIKHILYKSKVRSVLYGGVYDAVFFSPAGAVSQWFSTIGLPNYNHNPEMKELHNLHQEMNTIATHLFDLYKNGKIDQSHDGLKTIERKSEQFLNVLSALEVKLGGK
jgi:hypothetical protein